MSDVGVFHQLVFVPVFHHLPIQNPPQRLQVIPPPVLPVEVVGVLPDVEGQQGLEALLDGVAGTGFLGDDKAAIGCGGEPDPAGAEEAHAFGGEFVLEGLEGTPLLKNLGGEGAAWIQGTAAGAELREVHLVVEDLSGVVEEGAGGFHYDLFEGETFEAAAGQEFVEVVHVGLEVFAVVEAEGLRADHGFERVGSIGEGLVFEHIRVVPVVESKIIYIFAEAR